MSTTTTTPENATRTAPATLAPSPKGTWWIVAGREILTKLTNKAFVFSTIIMLLVVIGSVGVNVLLAGKADHYKVAVADDRAAAVVTALDASVKQHDEKSSAKAVRAGSLDEGKKLVTDEEADALLVPSGKGWTVYYNKSNNSELTAQLQTMVQQVAVADLAAKAHVSPAEAMGQTQLTSQLLTNTSDRAAIAQIAGLAFAVLFFITALTFGLQIATSVVEEKASRVVEIIASSISVRALLVGKVLGNTILALGQMVLLAAIGVVALYATGAESFLPMIAAGAGWFLVFFLAGFLALACVWAAAGSLVSRTEDLQAATTPVTMVLMGIYFLGLFATGTVRTIASFVPIASSVAMPARIIEGDAQWWEPVVSLALTLGFAALAVWLGERIFRRALLQTGAAISYRKALKLTD